MTTTQKTCRECHQPKPLTEFYRHPAMADGHLNKCKECVKSRVKSHRVENIERIRAYDRERDSQAHRVTARAVYAKTEQGKASHAKSLAKYEKAHPMRKVARNAANNALRDGKIARQLCWECGEEAEMHHAAYDYPLAVSWLCPKHHAQLHKEHRENMRSMTT